MKWDENDIEYVIGHLDVPGSIMEDEFVKWLETEEHRELFEMLLNHREAFLRHEGGEEINTEVEYRYLEHKIIVRRRINYLKWSAVAAVVVLGMTALFFNLKNGVEAGFPVTDIYEGKKRAELILANGESVRLEKNRIELREQNGMWVVDDSCCQLEYRRDTLKREVENGEEELTYNTLRIPSGADYVVRLSDGTRVHLNCETEFRFPVIFAKNERRVYLEGEAFLEVEKAADWPFIVETDRMKVQVTGTAFNVKSYRHDDIAAATLVSGSVKIESGSTGEEGVVLTPSQQFRLNKITGRSEVNKVDVRLYTGWVEGMFVFRNQRLEEVMNMLARWYSIDVFYVDSTVKDLRLSANLGRYEHIDSLLQIIQAVNKVKIERKGNMVLLDWK